MSESQSPAKRPSKLPILISSHFKRPLISKQNCTVTSSIKNNSSSLLENNKHKYTPNIPPEEFKIGRCNNAVAKKISLPPKSCLPVRTNNVSNNSVSISSKSLRTPLPIQRARTQQIRRQCQGRSRAIPCGATVLGLKAKSKPMESSNNSKKQFAEYKTSPSENFRGNNALNKQLELEVPTSSVIADADNSKQFLAMQKSGSGVDSFHQQKQRLPVLFASSLASNLNETLEYGEIDLLQESHISPPQRQMKLGENNDTSDESEHVINWMNAISKIQEKLPKSAGYVPQENKTNNISVTNSFHNISVKNNPRSSYTMKTNAAQPGMEYNTTRGDRKHNSLEKVDRRNNSLEKVDRKNSSLEKMDRRNTALGKVNRRNTMGKAERRNNSLEKVNSSLMKKSAVGIIETKSPAFMDTSDSDFEPIELVMNSTQKSNAQIESLKRMWMQLEYPVTYKEVRETNSSNGITSIKTPILQSSEEFVNDATKIANIFLSQQRNENQCSLVKIFRDEDTFDANDTIIAAKKFRVQQNIVTNTNPKADYNIANAALRDVMERVNQDFPCIRYDNPWNQMANESYTRLSGGHVKKKVNACHETKETYPFLNMIDDDMGYGNSNPTEIPCSTTATCQNNNKSTQINSKSQPRNKDYISNHVDDNNNSQKRTKPNLEAEEIISPAASFKSSTEQDSSSYSTLKFPSEAMVSENPSTISLRTSDGMPFTVSSMSLQVARLLSQQKRQAITPPSSFENKNHEGCWWDSSVSTPKEIAQVAKMTSHSQKSKSMNVPHIEDQRTRDDKKGVKEFKNENVSVSDSLDTSFSAAANVVRSLMRENKSPEEDKKSRYLRLVETPTQTSTSEVTNKNKKYSPSPAASVLMHGFGNSHSCLSRKMSTSNKFYDDNNSSNICKTVYFNPDMLPRSSKQINTDGAPVCLRRQSNHDNLPVIFTFSFKNLLRISPLHFEHIVIDSTVSMYSVGSHLEGFLRIQNSSRKHICYRVTSCIPGRYQVIPSIGLLESSQTVAITIASMIPETYIKYEPDQFKVETLTAPPEVVTPSEQRLLWNEIPSNRIQKVLVARVRMFNSGDPMNIEEEEPTVNASTSYGDGIVTMRRINAISRSPTKQGVADICLCTIILGILAAAIHRFSLSFNDL